MRAASSPAEDWSSTLFWLAASPARKNRSNRVHRHILPLLPKTLRYTSLRGHTQGLRSHQPRLFLTLVACLYTCEPAGPQVLASSRLVWLRIPGTRARQTSLISPHTFITDFTRARFNHVVAISSPGTIRIHRVVDNTHLCKLSNACAPPSA